MIDTPAAFPGCEALRALMHRYGAEGPAEAFYWAVNRAFHAAEAEQYDGRHVDMFQGLRPIWARLLEGIQGTSNPWNVLDVGAGTGLVGTMLEQLVPHRLAILTMLDPTPQMLLKAKEKSRSWHFESEFIEGDISAVDVSRKYDIVTVNSVLHHIPDLEPFCRRVSTLLAPGGWLFTAQDPRAEGSSDEILMDRHRTALRRRRISRAAVHIWSSCMRRVGWNVIDTVAQKANDQLLRQQVVQRPMDIQSMWAVTDFHVPGLPGGIGSGVAVSDLTGWLHGLSLVQTCTYQYFGMPWNRLTDAEKQQSAAWWNSRDTHGELFAAAWQKTE